MTRCRHWLYADEAAFGTWVLPDIALPVESSEVASAREALDLRLTGACRGLYNRVLGAKVVNGPTRMPWWCQKVGPIFKTFLRDTATAAGVGDTHAFLPDDANDLLGISMQQQYTSTLALNVLSAVVSSMTIRAAAKEIATLEFAFIAKDEAKAGGTWDFDGSASPAVISIVSQYPAFVRPLMFYDATVTIGGTVAITSKIISISGGTDYAKVSNVEIVFSNGMDADAFGLTTDPTIQEAVPGNREITLTFDISWSDYATTFYDNARAGTTMAFELALVGPLISGADYYEGHVILPKVFFDPAKLPPLTGDTSKPTLTITGKGILEETTTDKDFNLWIKNAEDTI